MVQGDPPLPETARSATVAAELARRLAIAQRSLTVALTAVVDVNAALIAIAGRPHLTTPCHVGAHPACLGFCSCEDCREPCGCECHIGAAPIEA